jgi:hypothetical protein
MEKVMKSKSLIALAFLIGAVMPVDAGQKRSRQAIEATAWMDAWATVAGVRCKQNEVVFNIASAKIAALVETFNDADAAKETAQMLIDGKDIAEQADEKIARDGLDAWCNTSASIALALKLVQ